MRSLALFLAVICIFSSASAATLYWDESPNPGVTGYEIVGSDFSNLALTNRITTGRTNRIPDPGWLYLEIRVLGTNATSVQLIGQRLAISKVGSNTVLTLVPAAGTNRIEASDDSTTWTAFRSVFGNVRTNLMVAPAEAKKFYRIAAR